MSVLKHPHVTEKAMNKMDFQNKLEFTVNPDASKSEIAEAMEEQFDVTATDVNTQVTMNGTKKATIKLSEEDDAEEIASRIGVF